MNKYIKAIGLTSILFSSVVNADLFRVEMGAGGWNQAPSGSVIQSDSIGGVIDGQYRSNENDTTNAYVWMLLKHPIPIVPNVRLEYAKLNDDGKSKGTFDNFSTPAESPSTIDVSEYDIIPYYNLMDNLLWTTIDLGLDLRIQTTKFKAQDVEILDMAVPTYATYEDDTTILIPLVYARVRVEIPMIDVGLESDVKYITYSGSTVYDIRAKVDYTMSFIPVLQPGLELGYRVQKFDVTSDDDNTKTDLTFSGIYGGLTFRF
jgi:outer membrane protein